jgi:hypothetical protein
MFQSFKSFKPLAALALVMLAPIEFSELSPWGLAQALAQKDRMTTTESLGALKVMTPNLQTGDGAVEEKDITIERKGERTDVTEGPLKMVVRRAPPYIRDAIRFLVAWGKQSKYALRAVATAETQVVMDGASYSLKEAALILPAHGLSTLRGAEGTVLGMRVRQVRLRAGDREISGSAVLTLAPKGNGYIVTRVEVRE